MSDKENMKDYVDKHIKGGWSDDKNKKGFLWYLDNGWIYLFENNSVFVGNIILSPNQKEKGALHINSINIKKDFQGKGYGNNILEFIEEKGKEFNFKKLTLGVFDDNPAFNLYRRFGFKQVGIIPEMNMKKMEKLLE